MHVSYLWMTKDCVSAPDAWIQIRLIGYGSSSFGSNRFGSTPDIEYEGSYLDLIFEIYIRFESIL